VSADFGRLLPPRPYRTLRSPPIVSFNLDIIPPLQLAKDTDISRRRSKQSAEAFCVLTAAECNVVGEQATKSAGAGWSLAYTTHNALWQAVSNRMYGDTSELCEDHEKATVVWY